MAAAPRNAGRQRPSRGRLGTVAMKRLAAGACAAVVAAVAATMAVRFVPPMRHEVVGISMAPGLMPGDVVSSRPLPVLDRWQPARRFDRWAFTAPDGTPAVKRIVGLPGESVSIVDGDLLIDGEAVPAPPDVLAGTAAPVTSPEPAAGNARSTPAWTSDSAAWRRDAAGAWAWERSADIGDWLSYRHRVRDSMGGRDGADRPVDSPILDDAAFAPKERRLLLPVRDFGIAVVISPDGCPADGSTRVCIRVGDGSGVRTVAVPVKGRTRLAFVAGRLDRHLVAAAWSLPAAMESRPDRRSPLPPLPPMRWSLAAAWERSAADPAPFAPPILGLGVESAALSAAVDAPGPARLAVERLVVWRDILHRPPADGTANWSVGDRELFLLGDFPPASRDCRQWGPLAANRLLYRVVTPE